MASLYEPTMDVATMKALGFTEEDMEETNTFYIYPDNWESFSVFEFLGTQWRTTSGGVVGLDYNVIPFAFDMLEVEKDNRAQVMGDIRIMEGAAIALLNAESNKKRN